LTQRFTVPETALLTESALSFGPAEHARTVNAVAAENEITKPNLNPLIIDLRVFNETVADGGSDGS
jgi:hypothetical protein